MIWKICFSLSTLFFILAFIVITIRPKRKNQIPFIKPFNLMIVFIALSSFCMFLPIYSDFFVDTGTLTLQHFKTIILSIHNTIRLFVVDSDFEMINEAVSSLPVFLKNAYPILASLLFIVAPILTFGFILSFFKNAVSYIKYLMAYKKDAYVFSELNDYAVTLATDIYKNHKKAVIIFTDVYSAEDEVSYELLERAQLINAICFRKDITLINFNKHDKKSKLTFFILNKTEDENTKSFMHLNKAHKDREKTEIFIFSKNIISDLLISSFPNTKIKIRRINYAQALTFRTLYESGYELIFAPAKLDKNGSNKKIISAVIVGLGHYGKSMAKTLAWYGQMDGYKIKITAIDEDKNAQSIFASECPELMDRKYNGVCVEGEAEYSITIHSGINYKTKEFDEKIKEIDDATFVFVSLGSDNVNIDCSSKLRMLFERYGVTPSINTIVYDSDEKEALINAENFKHQKYNFNFIGGIETTYSEAVIIDSELEQAGLEINRGYGASDETFWKYEYNYRSSLASALHMRARIKCNIPGADKNAKDITPEEKAGIELLEHKRWNAYMRSEGYVYDPTRNDLAKTHNDLVVFDKLDEETKRKDSKVGVKSK